MNYQPQTFQTQPPAQGLPYNGTTPGQVAHQACKYTETSFAQYARNYPSAFQLLVGLYFKEASCLPHTIGNVLGRYGPLGELWWRDSCNMDRLEHDPTFAHDVWKEEMADQCVKETARDIGTDPRTLAVFHEALRSWAQDRANDTLIRETLTKANLTQRMLSSNEE